MSAEPAAEQGIAVPSSFHTEHLAKCRGRVTGESRKALKALLRDVEEALSDSERDALATVLRGESADLPRRIAERILPAAVAAAQRDLEGAVFVALLRALDHLLSHRTAWSARLGDVVHKVESDRNRVWLHVNPVILGPLLCELLPVNDGGEVRGVCGLRVQPLRGHMLEFYLIDRREQARVVLTGVTEGHELAAWAYVALTKPEALAVCKTYADKLSPAEFRHRVTCPDSTLTSALLRRSHLLRDVWWLKVTRDGRRLVSVEWQEEQQESRILAGLCHPVVGVGAETKPSWSGLGLASVKGPDGEILLRSTSGTSPRSRREASKAWEAWERACPVLPPEERAAHRSHYTLEDRRRLYVRRELDLPDTTDIAQRHLETSLLLAARACETPQVFAEVSPRKKSLTIDLADGAAMSFFRALLNPLEPGDDRAGVPGLRIQPASDRLHLKLISRYGTMTDACVTVKRIGAHAWDQIWADIRSGRCVDPLRSRTLSAGERHHIGFQRRQHGPIALGSALLRRIGLLGGTSVIGVELDESGYGILVKIKSGPPLLDLAEALTDPEFGMVGDRIRLTGATSKLVSFVDTDLSAAQLALPPSSRTDRQYSLSFLHLVSVP